MIDFNHILFGACLFITSYSLILTKKLSGKYLKKTCLYYESIISTNNCNIVIPSLRNETKATGDISIINDKLATANDNSSTASMNSTNSLSTGTNSRSNNNDGLNAVLHTHGPDDRSSSNAANSNSCNNGNPNVNTMILDNDNDTSILPQRDRNISMVDLMLPYMENEILTNLINDEVVSSVIVGNSL